MAHKSSICTMSLGRCFAGHSLSHKLDMAQKYGFQGIEVFYEDLVDLASSLPGGPTGANQITAAQTIRQMCRSRGMDIIALQPFMHFGGLVDREEHRRRVQELKLWFELVHALGTDLILFPSSFLPSEQLKTGTGHVDQIVDDFAEASDMGLRQSPVVRFAYEALCWGTRVDTWEASWDIVQRVDRPNFGVCIDSYNMLGRIYADPAAPDGRVQEGDCQAAVIASTQRLLDRLDVGKLFLLQVADGERLSRPLDKHHAFYVAEQPARMSWSRNARLFYGEPQFGGYLPCKHVLSAVVQGLGFEGWLSFEVFNRRLADRDSAVPEEMARRAAVSFDKMKKDLGLRTEEETQGQAPRLHAML